MANTRSLEAINRKLFKGSSTLQATLQSLLAIRRPVSVLEIGCGAGRALMELALEFRHEPVRFSAINKERGRPLTCGADLPRLARELGVPWEGEGAEWPVPELFFEDATEMHFEDESFDMVYASSVMRFVPHKAEFIEEIARVLKPGGVAVVRVSGKDWDYPQGPISGGAALTPFAARWVLKYQDELIPLGACLTLASGTGFTLELINRPNCVIRVTKHRRAALTLGLQFVPSLSVPMREMGYGDDDLGLAKGGVRSVYEVPDAQYRRLVESGILAHDTDRTAPADNDARPGFRSLFQPLFESVSRALPALAPIVHPLHRLISGVAHHIPPVSSGAVHQLVRFDWVMLLCIGILGTLALPKRKRDRLKSYRVGQRVNIKGRRRRRCFRAAKIKVVHRQAAPDHLEGSVEWVNAEDHTLGLFGITARVLDPTTGAVEASLLRELRPGMAVRVRGKSGDGCFWAGEIATLPASAILVEEIQGPIEAISPRGGVLRVAGVPVAANRDTKIEPIESS